MTNIVKCHLCGTTLHSIDTKKCATCGAYQNNPLRQLPWLTLIGGALTVLAAVASAGAFVVKEAKNIIKEQNWTDNVELVTMKSKTSFTLRNAGDGRIHIHEIVYYSQKIGYKQSIPIAQSVESQSIYSHSTIGKKSLRTPLTRELSINEFNEGYEAKDFVFNCVTHTEDQPNLVLANMQNVFRYPTVVEIDFTSEKTGAYKKVRTACIGYILGPSH
ncbi:hypothetical protein L2D14_11425 [Thalassospiraceae bacterium LMO-JJ14]|nr:hypothetical protein L2D14_11425 [Thalassospiraceae bacterium LMO-JJ14]